MNLSGVDQVHHGFNTLVVWGYACDTGRRAIVVTEDLRVLRLCQIGQEAISRLLLLVGGLSGHTDCRVNSRQGIGGLFCIIGKREYAHLQIRIGNQQRSSGVGTGNAHGVLSIGEILPAGGVGQSEDIGVAVFQQLHGFLRHAAESFVFFQLVLTGNGLFDGLHTFRIPGHRHTLEAVAHTAGILAHQSDGCDTRILQRLAYFDKLFPGLRYFQIVFLENFLIVVNAHIVSAVGQRIIFSVILFGHLQSGFFHVIQEFLIGEILHITVGHLLRKLHLGGIVGKQHRDIAGGNPGGQHRACIRHRIHFDLHVGILRVEFVDDLLITLLGTFFHFLLEKLQGQHISVRGGLSRIFRAVRFRFRPIVRGCCAGAFLGAILSSAAGCHPHYHCRRAKTRNPSSLHTFFLLYFL